MKIKFLLILGIYIYSACVFAACSVCAFKRPDGSPYDPSRPFDISINPEGLCGFKEFNCGVFDR